MRIATAAQMKKIDELTINDYGIPGIALMENAGRAVAEHSATHGKSFCVVCGKGNNGGDGFVAARHLHNSGATVTILLMCDPEELSGNAFINFSAAKKIGIKIKNGFDEADLAGCDVVIDALLGIGAVGAPRGKVKSAIDAINRSGKYVISVDIPSGMNPDSGVVEGGCVRANSTLTFGLFKWGLLLYPAAEYAGEVTLCNISFAEPAIQRQNITAFVTENACLTKRFKNSHKGTYGKVFAICGSINYTGAAYLSSLAALKSGCGVVTLGAADCISDIMACKLNEAIIIPLKSSNGMLSYGCIDALGKELKKADAILCGCGLGRSDDLEKIVSHIIETSQAPLILDADGINAIADNKSILKRKKCKLAITPHIGEMSRLTGISPLEIQNNAVAVAKNFACEYNVITVLKGANSIVALPNGDIHLNTGGNSGMATAGSGDVLAGIIASFAAQGLALSQAAISGVYIHALSGDCAAEQFGQHGMLASDILNSIPFTLKKIGDTHDNC
ncbi:MAG: NAD(P)H-hydrate dehydratase [Firmicutes bacterium]|nr:NAD(P)H-hydrate dehydratase [Bacillota bacterium]